MVNDPETDSHSGSDSGSRSDGDSRSAIDSDSDDAELAVLVEEFSIRKTYRPSDGLTEPDEVPQGPSGSTMGETAPPVQGVGELEGH
ncbi:hypothetical protein ABT025_21885 [Streptomyces sp. NPDC002809]|uniref:hypothetical protein n=1 Tax=Streptomyces sp. NPDC002809 TaxID=3154433 RepID=UPI0033216717